MVVLYELYKNGWTFGSVIDMLSDKFKGVVSFFGWMMDHLRGMLPEWAGGISKDEVAKRDAAREIDDKKREVDEQKIRDANAARAKDRNKDDKPTVAPKIANINNPFTKAGVPSIVPKHLNYSPYFTSSHYSPYSISHSVYLLKNKPIAPHFFRFTRTIKPSNLNTINKLYTISIDKKFIISE